MKIEDYFKYYIQGSDHYLIPKDVFVELFEEMLNWIEETKRLIDINKEHLEINGKLREENKRLEERLDYWWNRCKKLEESGKNVKDKR